MEGKRKFLTAIALIVGILLIPSAASAADTPGAGEGLSPEQVATIDALETAAPVSASAVAKPAKGAVAAAATRRASYYQGSFLMWTRDNVDFGFDWSRVNWSSGFQQDGWIWPNISRNNGIGRYYAATRNHKWRASNSFGAGVPTPWGDVKVYNLTYTTDINVQSDGAWQARRS